jgi:dipeptidyl aminopeptidase/acylaminoacyl peptidase
MIPLEDFFRKPDTVYVRLSPDGSHLAYMAPHERRLNVFVRNLETGETTRVTDSTERDIGGYLWANDERLIYVQDKGGDENYRLYGIGRDGSNPLEITPFENVKCDIVDDLEDVEDEILFQMNRRDPHVFDVFRLDVNTGEMELAAENPGNVQSWITDHDGKLRLATTTDGVSTSILHRGNEGDEWQVVATYNFKESATPLFFTFDNRRVYVSSNVGRDKSAIYEYDLESGETTDLIYEHPEVDVYNLLQSRKRKKIVGVSFETDKPDYEFFDDARAETQRFLDEKLPGMVNTVVSYSRDETRYVVHSGSDRTMGGYYLLDLKTMELTHLFDLSPWLDADQMAEMRPVSYRARDGLLIHGYLTVPRGADAKSLPLIVHPHGGPWVRDSWGFNPEVQFLANRGYAVLQMNYRGSTGYGREFWETSFGKWGLEMQDDVTDAVRWAIDEGIADPKRVAIYGGSYGGYATLAGVTKTPDLYACAISYVGVSNLFTWIEAIPPYWKPYLEMMYEMVGHPERDEERFKKTSPYFNADRIQVPLFVAQGANDPRVRKEESDQIVDALSKRGVDVEYLVKDNEGHGFRNEENMFEFYHAMEAFLTTHL